MIDRDTFDLLQEEIIEVIKSRLVDNDAAGSFCLEHSWSFYLGTLDSLLEAGQIEDLKMEINRMRAELTELESRIP